MAGCCPTVRQAQSEQSTWASQMTLELDMTGSKTHTMTESYGYLYKRTKVSAILAKPNRAASVVQTCKRYTPRQYRNEP